MSSFPFPTYSGLLEPKHYKRIGSAIWLFLWCISSTTKEVEKDGVVWGIVLGNKPQKVPELAEKFGVEPKTVRRWAETLENNGYIKITRAPYGLIFTVKNSKKYKPKRMDKNVQSDRDRTKMSTPDRTDMSSRVDKNVHSNKDIIADKYITTAAINTGSDETDAIAERFADLKTIQSGKPELPNAEDYKAIAQIVALGVPLPITIKLLEQCFEEFDRKKRRGKISSFNYCVPYIQEKWEDMQERERAREVSKNNIHQFPLRKEESDHGEHQGESSRDEYDYGF